MSPHQVKTPSGPGAHRGRGWNRLSRPEMSSHRFVGPDYSLIDDFPYPDDLAASAAAQAEYKQQVQVLLENSVQSKFEGRDDGRW